MTGSTVVVRRTIAATVDELFDAWLDPECLAQWMRPGLESPSKARVDARVGGSFEIVMQHPAGPLRHHGVYHSIERNSRLVFTWHSDATGHGETLVTVQFLIVAGGTEIVVTHERLPAGEAIQSHTEGWSLALALLAALFPH